MKEGRKELWPRKTTGLERGERTKYVRGMWDAVHRQDEAKETERTGIPGATPKDVREDGTHRLMQISLRPEEGPSFTSQEIGQKKGSQHLHMEAARQQVCWLLLTLPGVNVREDLESLQQSLGHKTEKPKETSAYNWAKPVAQLKLLDRVTVLGDR